MGANLFIAHLFKQCPSPAIPSAVLYLLRLYFLLLCGHSHRFLKRKANVSSLESYLSMCGKVANPPCFVGENRGVSCQNEGDRLTEVLEGMLPWVDLLMNALV